MKLTTTIDVLAGDFASQPLAFAHLMDAACRAGLSPDFDHIEVVPPAHETRLRGMFDEATVRALTAAAGQQTLILVLPGALITGEFHEDQRLRRIGHFAGEITRVAP